MTKREFYASVIATETIAQELRDFAAEEIAKMDARNSARKAADRKLSEKEQAKVEADMAMFEEVVALLGEGEDAEPKRATEIAEVVGCKWQKIPALVKKYGVDRVKTVDMKVKGGRTVKGYVAL